jgi:hypothetical protein
MTDVQYQPRTIFILKTGLVMRLTPVESVVGFESRHAGEGLMTAHIFIVAQSFPSPGR